MAANNDIDKDSNGESLTTHSDGGMATSPPTYTVGLDTNKPAPARPPSMKMKKNVDKQRKKLSKMMVSYRNQQVKAQAKVNHELDRLRQLIGDEDFEALKAMATTYYPEKKDDKGVVTQEAYNAVNHKALLTEANNFLVLRREKRIKEGLRKRSTGRSSDRKLHAHRYKHIVERGKKAIENKEEVSTVKV